MAETFDYIVVGAGSAGCVVANRLSADPSVRVLIIEAGGKDTHPFVRMPMGFLFALRNPKLRWTYFSEPEPSLGGRRLFLPRGRVLGGSSSINGMVHMRGHPLDYDTWAQMGCAGWSHADVLPYFKRSEKSWRGGSAVHGGDGPLSVKPIDGKRLLHEPLMQSAKAAGYAATSDLDVDGEGFALGEINVDARGRRHSAARAFLYPALARPNLTLIMNATTLRVVLEKGRAVGVEIAEGGATRIVRAEREVILSGGAYNSPQLLMLSGIGPADELRAHGIGVAVDSPGVGKNLSEHARVPVVFAATKPVTFIRELRIDRAAMSVARWALFGDGAFASQVSSCNIVIRTRPELAQPDVQLMSAPIRLDAKLWAPGINDRQEHRMMADAVVLHPHARGHVKLASADPRANVRIQLNIFDNEADRATARAGIRAARHIYRTGAQGELTGREILPGPDVSSDAALDAFIAEHAGVTQHPVGTCAMGVGPEAVVDPELRVRGVEGLRVVDASIMPTVPGANTNASAIMVGEKGADLVLGKTRAA